MKKIIINYKNIKYIKYIINFNYYKNIYININIKKKVITRTLNKSFLLFNIVYYDIQINLYVFHFIINIIHSISITYITYIIYIT